MTWKTITDFSILVLAFGGAFIIIGYEDHARMNGWPVGAWLSGNAPPLKIFSFIVGLTALGVAFYAYKWWTPLAVLSAGIALGFIASKALRHRVQLAAILGAVIGWVLCLVYVR